MRKHARSAIAAFASVLLLSLAACTSTDGKAVPDGSATGQADEPAPASTGQWLSGASGNGVPRGELGQWRGRDLDIAGTWSDTDDNAQHFYQLQSGGDYSSWRKPLDMAVGGLREGQSWSEAATGAYDAEWASSLTKLRQLRSTTTATTYIRFAHEMNGDWYPWKVNRDNYRDFITSWKRYRSLQERFFPAAKLVFSLNRQSVGTAMDWRRFFPGTEYVDLLSVDYYNQFPAISTEAQWTRSLSLVDQWGAPNGLEKFRAYAQSRGLPLAISEWSGNALFGDSPAFVTGFLDYVKSHAGTSAGEVPYEILFGVPQDEGKFVLYGQGLRMPESSAAYRKFFETE